VLARPVVGTFESLSGAYKNVKVIGSELAAE